MGILTSIMNLLSGGKSENWQELMAQGAEVVDVRTRKEFKQGHLANSTNIPLDELQSKMSQFKSKQVILVCRSGARAGKAKGMLMSSGITAYNAGPWQTLKS